MDKYISKGDWFDIGTEVELIDDYRPIINSGLFCGFRKGKLDEEICSFTEFKIKDKI